MTIKYIFREGPLTIKNAARADPQKIGEALEKIAAANGGEIPPRATMQAARQRSSPLHQHFEWNNEIAGEAYRLDQARSLIRSIAIVSEDRPDITPRAFVSITEPRRGTSYRVMGDVLQSVDLQLILLRQAERDCEAMVRRLKGFQDLCEDVRELQEKFRKRASALDAEKRDVA